MIPSKNYRSGSKRNLYFTVAEAVGCNPASVEEWDRKGDIPHGLLCYLEAKAYSSGEAKRAKHRARMRRWREQLKLKAQAKPDTP